MSGLPAELALRVEAFLEGELRGEAEVDALADDLADALDGQTADTLRTLLDELRGSGGYALSLRLLSRAWAGTLSDDLAGEVAQDWIGTLLHGLNDREAAAEVARFLTPEALERGAAFAADLGDLLLSWGLRAEAEPLIEHAARRNPGDLEAQFNLGVVLKFRRQWAESASIFRMIAVHRPEPAVQWNLGIACTALRDFAAARKAWRAVGLEVPESDGDFARPGERVPVRLSTTVGAPVAAEVVWGDRLCPARVRLTGIPRYFEGATFGDTVLVDGLSVGEAPIHDQRVPIVECLDVFESAGGRLFRLRTPLTATPPSDAPTRIAAELRAAGYAATDWRGVGPPAVGVVLPVNESAESLAAAVRAAVGVLPFRCPELEGDAADASADAPLPRW